MGSKDALYADIEAFHSAVTGSCILVNIRFPDMSNVKFLVDCGMYHEKKYESLNSTFGFSPESIQFVFITHSHIDHIGRLPLLVKKGYNGPIYASKIAADYLIQPALRDSQSILETESKIHGTTPLYNERDVDSALSLKVGVDYLEEWSPHENINVIYFNNAHVPGAAIIFVQAKYEGYEPINLLFTGDYNNKNAFFCSPKLPDEILKLPITVVQEATYGTTNSDTCTACFEDKFSKAVKEYPYNFLAAYSFNRIQEVSYRLCCMQKKKLLSTDIPIYLDGALAIKYTNIYPKLGISEIMEDFLPENIHFVSNDEREKIAYSEGRKIILSSSGNASYGPAQFYTPIFIRNPKAYIGFTGYVQEGTLGRELQSTPNGSLVKIGSSHIPKLAQVEFFTEFSAHAKADELIGFLNDFENLKFVLVNHGEQDTKIKYAERVRKEVNTKKVEILERGTVIRVNAYGFVKSFNRV